MLTVEDSLLCRLAKSEPTLCQEPECLAPFAEEAEEDKADNDLRISPVYLLRAPATQGFGALFFCLSRNLPQPLLQKEGSCILVEWMSCPEIGLHKEPKNGRFK